MSPDNASTHLDDFDLPAQQAPVPPVDDVLVVPYRPPGGKARVVPAVIAIMLALGLLGYRVAQPDWHWEWLKTKPKAPAQLARAGNPSKPQPAKLKSPAAPKPEANPKVAATKPAVPDATKAIDEIQQEADRIRAQREELAKIKEREGEKIAAAPKPPGPRGRNAVALAQQQARMGLMRQDMADHQRRVQAMLRAQREFLARNGLDADVGRFADRFGPDFADVDRAFERMRREMDAFDREALALLGENGVPAPPAPAVGANGFEMPQGQPQVQRFNFVDKNGNRVSGFQMRWSQSQ